MAAREYYVAILEMDEQMTTMNIEERQVNVELMEGLETISLDNEHAERITHISTQASPSMRKGLTLFLRDNLDVFAWTHENMLEIDLNTIVHQLSISPSFPPIRQRKRVFAQERDKAIAEEVHKLLGASFIKEVYYPEWLANMVMVKKANEK